MSTADWPRLFWTSVFAYSMGFTAPFLTKSEISPGWATNATVGGFPPSTAVASTVGRLSPADVYLTLTFGLSSVKPSITFWNARCSGPLQTPITEMLPEMLLVDPPPLDPLELLLPPPHPPPPDLPPPPPHPAARPSASTASAAHTGLTLICCLRCRRCHPHRCRAPSPDRRSAVLVCPPPPPRARPP